MSEIMATETVYGTTNDESRVMSEKVQSLAGSVYKEFEKVINNYNEDVVKDLMPLVVGILEALDSAFSEKQELDVETELLREDNEQLLNQYEREKQLRKTSEQKYLELEDSVDGTKKELEEKVETLESILRMSEIKSKNSADQVSRLEEREQEAKNEYNKLHERYTELFRTHMDYMERTKILLGTDKLSELTVTSPRVMKPHINLSELRPVSVTHGGTIEYQRHIGTHMSYESTVAHGNNVVTLRSELESQAQARSAASSDVEQLTDSINVTEKATNTRLHQTLAEIIASTPELVESHSLVRSHGSYDKLSAIHNDSSVFEEIQATDIAEVDFGGDSSDSEKEEDEGDDEGKENDNDSVGDNFYGMCRELENLIQENTELLATKNALNVVKDDLIAKIEVVTSDKEVLQAEIMMHNSVRKKLQDRISVLEEEVKRLKEELENRDKQQTEKEVGEEDVPLAQRKRFTRVEMARVLMERNQFKERLMELQEAVRWTEMIRASKEHPGELQTKKKSGVWNFFGNLFSSSNKAKSGHPAAVVGVDASTANLQSSAAKSLKGDMVKSKSHDVIHEDLSEKAKKEREKDRKDQYKQVRALVKKDDGRMQAYGWSLPVKFNANVLKDGADQSQLLVPVPIYCRPLSTDDTDWKIWCAAGVNLTGLKNREGDYVSMMPSHPLEDVSRLDLTLEWKESEKKGQDGEKDEMSSLVWVCTSTHDESQVSVIDANNPSDILETFTVSASHIICIASVPGVLESDFPVGEEILNSEIPFCPPKETTTAATEATAGAADRSCALEELTFVQCETGETGQLMKSPSASDAADKQSVNTEDGSDVMEKDVSYESVEEEFSEDQSDTSSSCRLSQALLFRARGSPASSGYETPSSGPEEGSSATDLFVDGRSVSSGGSEGRVRMRSSQPTMWLGTQNGSLYVYSSVSDWRRCLHSVVLKDCILSIVHTRGRVLASLADGTVAVFHRATDGQWDLLNYHLLDLVQEKQPIRCMTVVGSDLVWCGHRNKVHIVCPQFMTVKKSFDAHPRKESQVRQLCWAGEGVWISIRLDSTLRLYHAYTQQHLQDVDVEPYVSKLLGTGKLGFSFVRVTAMFISCGRLWVGTSNGVIMSIPLSESNQPMIATSTSLDSPSGTRPGGVVRVYSDTNLASSNPGSLIPYCSMADAQLSFHGNKDAVKFFVCVPGIKKHSGSPATDRSSLTSEFSLKLEAVPAPPTNTKLILSGGEGYVDFRLGEGSEEDLTTSTSSAAQEDDVDTTGPDKAVSQSRADSSHIIMWQVTTSD